MGAAQTAPGNPPGPRERIVLKTMPALGGLYAKAAGRTLGTGATAGLRRALGGMPLPTPWQGARRRPAAARLPAVELVIPAVEVEAEAHQAFCEVVGARPHTVSVAPSTLFPGGAAGAGQDTARDATTGGTEAFSGYLHALAFPAATALLTREDFPLPTVGLVHLANSVRQSEPVLVGEHLSVTVWAENLRAHRAGTTVDVVVELRRTSVEDVAEAAAVTVPWNRPVWTGRSVYLTRGVHRAPETADTRGGAGKHAKTQRPEFVAPEQTARWQLKADTGRRYAAVSGDVNPIHLSSASARLLGMKGAIAHGMYTASRALAMVDAPTPLSWEVEFASPLVLPAAPAVAVERDGRGRHLREATVTVWDARRNRPHAVLQVRR